MWTNGLFFFLHFHIRKILVTPDNKPSSYIIFFQDSQWSNLQVLCCQQR